MNQPPQPNFFAATISWSVVKTAKGYNEPAYPLNKKNPLLSQRKVNPMPTSHEANTDEMLLQTVANGIDDVQGREFALRELYGRYSNQVFSLAKRILNNQSDSEEIVQDVFVRIWSQAATYAPERGKVSTWIMTIAHRCTIDLYRRNRIRSTVPAEPEQIENLAIGQPNDVLTQMTIRSAINKLPADERKLLEAMYFQGLSHNQLAQSTGLPLGSIKTKIRNALHRLREPMKDEQTP